MTKFNRESCVGENTIMYGIVNDSLEWTFCTRYGTTLRGYLSKQVTIRVAPRDYNRL